MSSFTRYQINVNTLLAAAAVFLAVWLYARLDGETTERRDQSCRGAEAAHAQEITDLVRQYEFYIDPPPEFESLLKHPLVQQGLRDAERDAKFDRDEFGVFVAPFCDEPGIGLDEPDPEVPDRPAALDDEAAP